LFFYFGNGGFRVLGDIICDFNDKYRKRGILRRLTAQKRDLKVLLFLRNIENSKHYKENIIS
jgi:hypothetical protein